MDKKNIAGKEKKRDKKSKFFDIPIFAHFPLWGF